MPLNDLTWEELTTWAGERVVRRGRPYRSAVEDLRVAPDGALLAWVQGGDRYAVRAGMDKAGRLFAECTCPYPGVPCKHAVAVVLAYLAMEEKFVKPPATDPDDERFAALSGADDAREDEDDDGPAHADADEGNRLVRAHLKRLSKKELADLLLEKRDSIPGLRRRLSDRAALRKGNIAKLTASIRREIEDASSEPEWGDRWRDENDVPDYSGVKMRLEELLAGGHEDAVLELGSYLMERATRQVAQSDDDGETGMEIAECMSVVFKALVRSNLPAPERILWEIDLRLKDQYDLLDGVKGLVESARFCGKADWSCVADAVADQLARMPERPPGGRDGFSKSYERDHVLHWLLRALDKAGRGREAVPLLERETINLYCYDELVKRLVAAGRLDGAREWARKGFVATLERLPGIAWQLEGHLRALAVRARDYPLAAAYRAMEFFDDPDVRRYVGLKEAAVKAGAWDSIRGRIFAFLETGRRPDADPAGCAQSAASKERKRAEGEKGKPAPGGWPLPPTGLPMRAKDPRWARFPDTDTLIDIAVKERRHADALRWYRAGKKTGFHYFHDEKGEEVARAVQNTHPNDAVAIWKEIVTQEIAQVKPDAYRAAGAYLKKIRAVLVKVGKESEWTAYSSELRVQNHRRPRMLDVLNAVEGRRTPIIRRGEFRRS